LQSLYLDLDAGYTELDNGGLRAIAQKVQDGSPLTAAAQGFQDHFRNGWCADFEKEMIRSEADFFVWMVKNDG